MQQKQQGSCNAEMRQQQQQQPRHLLLQTAQAGGFASCDGFFGSALVHGWWLAGCVRLFRGGGGGGAETRRLCGRVGGDLRETPCPGGMRTAQAHRSPGFPEALCPHRSRARPWNS
ncbi:unnamed protein product [Lampetra fluviatilis]